MTQTSLLIATDLSKNSLSAMTEGKRLAKALNAHITLLHVFDPAPVVPPMTPLGVGSISASVTKEIGHAVRKTLAEVAEEHFEGEEITVDARQGMGAAATICEYAKHHEMNYIVVATHGRTGLKHMLLGSVAEKVVRHAPCSVFVVR